jgi:DNA-binding CsgD family transcriptional regulator
MELLERDHILADLRRVLRQAAGGSGAVVLLAGEAGVGKSAVLRRFMAEVGAEAVTLLGQCDALSTPRPLGPLFDIADAEPALRRLLSEETPREHLFRAVLTRLASGTRPTVLAVEDAHWADEATLDLLRFLGRRIETTRSIVLVTYRGDKIGPRHPFQLLLGDLAAASSIFRLSIPPLSPAGVAALAAGSRLDAADLYARTGGNPFFVSAVIATGGGMPETVRDAVLARAGRLPATAWSVLEAAAVIGATVDPDALDRVTRATPEDLSACLESGILESHGANYVFRHELAREAIASAITPARRRTLHAQVLQDLEAQLDGQLHPARLAHHADEAGDRAAVLRHAPEAARRAARLRSHREAAEQYARTLRFADDLPAAERARLFEGLAVACYVTAQIDRAVAARQAALAIWLSRGDRRKEGENRCHLAILHWAEARTDDAVREATAAVATLESILPGPELAMAYATLGRLRGPTVGAAEGIASGERAIALAEQVQAGETLADALIDVGATHLAQGDERGLAQIERGLALASDAGLEELVARAYHNLGFGFGEQFQFDRAVGYFVSGIAYCAERDLDHPRLYMTAWLAYCRVFLGEWDEAEALVRSVLEAAALSPNVRILALVVASMLHVRRGEPDAKPLLYEALALASTSSSPYFLAPIHAIRAEAAWLAGDAAGCAGEAGSAYDLALHHRQRWYIGVLAYWRWKCGELAQPPSPIADPFERQIAGDWEGAASLWDALSCPYEAAWARGESDNEAALREALATFDRLGARPAAAIVRGRLRRRGARGIPRGPRPATLANPAGLTARETEIVTLVARGHSNQEIADHLFLSARTVENHIAAIRAKLGTPTREDAATAAVELGIVPQSE